MAQKKVILNAKKCAITRKPRIHGYLVNDNTATFKWCLHCDYMCFEHSYYGFKTYFANDDFIDIIKPQLDLYTSMKWAEVMKIKSNHKWEIQDIKDNELKQIYINAEIETAYQLCVPTGSIRHRLWGHRQDNVFYLVANDPEHDGYPVEKKHT
nr:MAG TPA: hypothetical protein [Caudoviricetes sp.]